MALKTILSLLLTLLLLNAVTSNSNLRRGDNSLRHANVNLLADFNQNDQLEHLSTSVDEVPTFSHNGEFEEEDFGIELFYH